MHVSQPYTYIIINIILQYGGDMSRKMKLLKFQAEGKARMRKVGNIEIPRQAFIDVLKK